MADSMDLVQQRVEEERQRHIHTARNRKPGVSRVLCVDCDAPIPPARRRAIPGVQCECNSYLKNCTGTFRLSYCR